jgi:hypothetical protein
MTNRKVAKWQDGSIMYPSLVAAISGRQGEGLTVDNLIITNIDIWFV